MVWLFHAFSFRADFSFAMILNALSGDSIEVYHGVEKNLFSKKSRNVMYKIKTLLSSVRTNAVCAGLFLPSKPVDGFLFISPEKLKLSK